MVLGQKNLKILFRDFVWKVDSLLRSFSVIFKHSDPYKRIRRMQKGDPMTAQSPENDMVRAMTQPQRKDNNPVMQKGPPLRLFLLKRCA